MHGPYSRLPDVSSWRQEEPSREKPVQKRLRPRPRQISETSSATECSFTFSSFRAALTCLYLPY